MGWNDHLPPDFDTNDYQAAWKDADDYARVMRMHDEGMRGMGFSEYSGKASSDVQAEQLTEQRAIITPNGPLTGEEGDWEVREPGGNVRRMSNEDFQAEYGGEASADKETSESVYDEGETGSYTMGDTESPVTDTDTHSGALDESTTEETESQSEDATGDDEESDVETPRPAPPRRATRR